MKEGNSLQDNVARPQPAQSPLIPPEKQKYKEMYTLLYTLFYWAGSGERDGGNSYAATPNV